MRPRPAAKSPRYKGSDKLKDKVALITGGDSGIGRAVAVMFAAEGCDVAVVYRSHTGDARETQRLVEEEGRRCLLIKGDVGSEAVCTAAVARTRAILGGLNILVNNAAEQHPQEEFQKITRRQIERTFRTNIFAMFYLAKAAARRMTAGDTIINTASVTAYRGSPHLIDYSATKGAIVAFTRSLSGALAEDGIRVNAVAPGPIWTPLITKTFPPKRVRTFGTDVPLGRPGQPEEVAHAFVFLASDDSSYITGQVIHANGGEIING